MSDDYNEIDKLLEEKRLKKEQREADEAASKAKAEERRAKNKEVLTDIILPVLNDIAENLSKRGMATNVVEEPGNTAVMKFNPKGRLEIGTVSNAHARISLGDSRSISTHYSTIYSNSGGQASSGPNISHDKDVAEEVKKFVLSVVTKTLN